MKTNPTRTTLVERSRVRALYTHPRDPLSVTEIAHYIKRSCKTVRHILELPEEERMPLGRPSWKGWAMLSEKTR